MTAELKNFWKFDDADLAANRNGQLTEKQKTFLTGEHKTQRGFFFGAGGLIAVLFCCLPILLIGVRVVLPMLLSGNLSDIQELIPVAALGGVGSAGILATVLIVGAVVGFYILRANKKADITVKTVKGTINYTWGTKRVRNPGNSARPYDDVRVLHLNISDKKFEVKEALQEIIKEGEAWAIYYTSAPFKFLSGEKSN